VQMQLVEAFEPVIDQLYGSYDAAISLLLCPP